MAEKEPCDCSDYEYDLKDCHKELEKTKEKLTSLREEKFLVCEQAKEQPFPRQLSANASLISAKGHVVAACKNIVVHTEIDHLNRPQAQIMKTKRINFKDSVSPNETLYIVVTDIQDVSETE